jgi:aminoglycoside/choline kinase family phosphotransferase
MDIPVRIDGLTPDWLTTTLQTTGVLAQARITALHHQDLGAKKGTTGQLARIRLDYDALETNAPRSLIAKFSSLDPGTREAVHSMGFYEREVRFYEQLAARSLLRTPRCYFGSVDLASGYSLLLLEDLAPARNGSSAGRCSVAEAESALRALAPFHATWWQQPLLQEHPWLQLRSFVAAEQLQAVFHQTWEPFLSKLSIPITDEIIRLGEWLSLYLERVSRYIYQEGPRTLIHHDFHADNLFFGDDSDPQSLVVADWQLTTYGRAVLDVAWFLGGSLDSNDRREHESRLLRIYYALLVDKRVHDYTFEQCLDDYRLAMLLPPARTVAAVGISALSGDTKKGGPWDVILPRYCRALHDFDAGSLLRDCADHLPSLEERLLG